MDHRGFTLIESLLVLWIVTTIVIVSQVVTIRSAEQFTDERVLAQFQYDMLLTQAFAMQSGIVAKLEFDGERTYHVTSHTHRVTRDLPAGAAMYYSKSVTRTIAYSNHGTTSAVGSIYYEGLHRDYNIVVHFGRGRITLEPL